MSPARPQTDLTLVVLAFVHMRPALTIRLNYGSIDGKKFNGVRPAQNIKFGLAGDLRLSRRELNLRQDSCKQST